MLGIGGLSVSLRAGVLLALGVALPEGAAASMAPGDLGDRAALERLMNETMTEAMEDDHIAGGVVAVVADGEIRLMKGYGLADVEAQRPVDPATTVFRVGSLAKLVVGTAVMQLVEDGRLDLDADVNTYLPHFKIPETFPQPVTLRHLLTHTAGFENRIIGNDRSRAVDDVRPLGEALVDVMPRRLRPPGKVASYSNWGVSLAGHVVELVSGLSFAQYADEHILAPIGMTRSTFLEPLPPELADEFTAGYLHVDGKFVPQDFEFIAEHAPAGALSSTATDMAAFMMAHLQKGQLGERRILESASAEEMHRRQFAPFPELPGLAINFGISAENDPRLILQHSGATTAFHANLMLFPREGVGFFVAFNGRGSAGNRVQYAFLERYFQQPDPPELKPSADLASRSQRYTGTYRHNRLPAERFTKMMHFHELTVHDTGRGTLFIGDLLSDTDNPDEGSEIYEVAPDVFWSASGGGHVAFSEDGSGEVEHLLLGAAMPSLHRIAWYETMHAMLTVGAVSLVVFIAAAVIGTVRLVTRRRAPEPVAVRAGRIALTISSATGAAFIVGFAAMVLLAEDGLSYPPGTEAILALPVAAAVATAVGAVFVAASWVRRDGSVAARIGGTAVILTAVVFFATLHLWKAFGWQL